MSRHRGADAGARSGAVVGPVAGHVVGPVVGPVVTAVGCALVLLPLSAWPATRWPAVVAATVLAALAPLVGIAVHRPRRRYPWTALSAMLWCLAVTTVAYAAAPAVSTVARTAGMAIGAGLCLVLYTRHRRYEPVERRRTRRETWGHRTDALVTVAVMALAVAQATASSLVPEAPGAWAIAPFDIVLVCLLLRFAVTRAELPPAMALVLAGGISGAVFQCLVTDAAPAVTTPHEPLSVLWTASMCLYLAGGLQPSMRTAFDPAALGRLRSESARLLGIAPLVLVPVVLSQLQSARYLPTTAHLVTGALVGALAIVRGAQTIQGSERLARQDPLTGLANRRGLRLAFDDLAPPTTPTGAVVGRLAVLDLDDFKHVNDTYGHETGDRLLVIAAERLTAAVGEHGIVARSGGDEFVLLLAPDGPDVDAVLAEAFSRPVELDLDGGRTGRVRCSAGWLDVTGGDDLPLLLADADVALYTGKAAARGTATRFEVAQREDVLGELALADDLRRLIAGEPGAGELVLHYQPLVALPDRTVLGCEALVRWQHPVRGLLGPDTFLPVAEAQGHGAALDAWVLHEACRSAVGWAAERWTVSVNLGRSSMTDPGLADLVRLLLDETGLPPHRLHLEITEHDQLPADAGVGPLHELAALGVGIALDDFGTGYTSVAYLQRYPIGVLKLDRSITGSDATGALLGGLVALAGALGVRVLAEGIEDDVQCARLARLGVDAGQGWLFGHPVPAHELAVRAPVGNPT